MAAIDYYPHDAAAPQRISVEDLGGDQKINETGYTPGVDEPGANEWNNLVRMASALDKMTPLAIITTDGAASPAIVAVKSKRTSIAASDFTVTDNGAGDITIEWEEGTLAPQTMEPRAYVHGATPHIVSATAPTALSVRVYTTTQAGAAADVPVTVEIW
jgi:hypothetical protein